MCIAIKLLYSANGCSSVLVIPLQVRPPLLDEVKLFPENNTLFSFIYPAQNDDIVKQLAARRSTVFGMECVPRISRAQVFDALSSMANISGYKAVVEAANNFGRFFTGQALCRGIVVIKRMMLISGVTHVYASLVIVDCYAFDIVSCCQAR